MKKGRQDRIAETLTVKLNFASETEEKKGLTDSIFRFSESTRNNLKTNVYGK